MRVLVVGGAGYIGSVVTRALVGEGHEPVVLDSLATGHRDAVPAQVEFIHADISQPAAVTSVLSRGVDAVMHFAALSLVGESVLKPELYWSTNVGGTRCLLDAMRAAKVQRLVFSSTSSTYGEPESVPIDELARVDPTSPYGSSKLAVDMMIRDESRAHGLAAVSLRYFNVAGAVADAGERHDPETHLIPNVLRVAAGLSPEVVLFGDDYSTPDGTCIRDYVHVEDLAAAHLLALDATGSRSRLGPGGHRVFNLGNGTGFSVLEVVEAARRVTGKSIPLRVASRREGDPAVLVASSRRIQTELGWSPRKPGLDQIVADAWAFLSDHP
ncbi:MAG: UDP-glucose 4-epimerase GalE [Candidatus Dormibacteria bacterium]|jgi:UDP-glucose 4-epimerase